MGSQAGGGWGWNHLEDFLILMPGTWAGKMHAAWGGGGKAGRAGAPQMSVQPLHGLPPAGRAGQPDILLCGSGLRCTCPKREGWRWEGSVCLLLWLRHGNHTASFWHVLSLRSKSLELPTSEPTLMRRALRNWRHVLSHHGELRWRVQHVDFGRWQSVVAVRSMHFRSPQ